VILEGEVVLEAEQWKTKKVSHQLPPLLPHHAAKLVFDIASKRAHGLVTQPNRDTRTAPEDALKDVLSHIKLQIVRRRLVIPRNKDLPTLPGEACETRRFRFTDKKPR